MQILVLWYDTCYDVLHAGGRTCLVLAKLENIKNFGRQNIVNNFDN